MPGTGLGAFGAFSHLILEVTTDFIPNLQEKLKPRAVVLKLFDLQTSLDPQATL